MVTCLLTTGVDDVVGTSADESFAAIQTGGTDETFGAADAINGGEGNDTLRVTNSEAAVLNLATVSNIENVIYRSVGGGGTIDQANFTGLTALTLDRSAGAADVANFELGTALTVADAAATLNTTVTYKGTTVASTADAGTVTVDGVTQGADLEFVGAIESMTVTASGSDSRFADFELPATVTALTIDAAAAFRVDTTFTAAAVTALTVTGAGAVTITPPLATTVLTVSAGTSTGAQTLTMGAAKQTITTGTGNDVIDMQGNLDKNDTIDLGEGDDTLRIDVDSLSAGAFDLSVSNVETFRFDNTAANSGAINMDNLAVAIRFDGANAAGQAATTGVVTLTDLAASIGSVDLIGIGSGTGGAPSDNVAFNGIVFDYDVSGTTTVSELTVNINNGGVVADDMFVQKLTADNTEAVAIVAADIGAAAADELTITEIEGNKIKSVTVEANGEVIISDIDGDVLETVSLELVAAGGAAVTISDHAAALSVTGSGFNDVITMTDNTNTSAVTVDLGAGNDTYVSVDAADTITTGTGSDTITIQGDAADDLNVIEDFTAGAGGDIIDIVTSVASNGSTGTDMTLTRFDAGQNNLALDSGITVFSGTNAASLSTANVAARLADTDGAAGGAIISNDTETDELAYILIDDGTDTGLFLITNDTGTTAILAAELTLLVTLTGVADATTLTAANFADFL